MNILLSSSGIIWRRSTVPNYLLIFYKSLDYEGSITWVGGCFGNPVQARCKYRFSGFGKSPGTCCARRSTEHKLPVIVGIGGNNTGQVVDQIKSFPFGRIDGILSVAPYYNKPTARGVYEHYRTLAAAAPVPVILYNVPGRTGVNIPAETILELAHTFDNIVAVKEASGNLNQVIRIAKDKPEKFLIISGDDALTVPIMSVGGAGVISVAANAWPAAFRQITDAALAGNFPEAAAVHYRFATMIDLLFADGNPGGIKAVLSELGLIGNHLRLPLVPVREEIRKKISKEVKKI